LIGSGNLIFQSFADIKGPFDKKKEIECLDIGYCFHPLGVSEIVFNWCYCFKKASSLKETGITPAITNSNHGLDVIPCGSGLICP
jgi:hypothetical protein